MSNERVVQLVRRGNPVPDSAHLPEPRLTAIELLSVSGRGEPAMTLTRTDDARPHTDTATSRYLRPVAAALSAAIVVILVFGATALLFGGGEAPGDTTLSPATEVAPPTTVAHSPLSLPDVWQRVGTPVMRPIVGLFDMVETSSGLVAVGFDPGEEDSRQNGVILSSIDGVTWTRLAEDDPALNLGTVLLYGVADGGPGIVAVGTGCDDDTEPCAPYPTVWTSVDGTAWDRSSADQEVFGERGALLDVVASEHGLVAAGGFYTTDGGTELIEPTVWLSPDGVKWERVWQGDAYDYTTASAITGFQALAAGADGRVVGVGTAVNDRGEFVGAIWTSTDGRTWERIDQNSEVFASNTDSDVVIQDVAAGPGGFVAVGSDGGTEVAVWHSSDGLLWTRAATADQPFDYIGSLGSVDALGTGWVIAGPHGFSDATGGTVTLWTSPDGATWDRVHSVDPGYAMSVVAIDSGIAIAGAIAGVLDYYAAVWAGPSFDPAAPPPDPGPTEPSAQQEAVQMPDEGLSCDELVDLGYEYIETVAYWVWYDRPSDLDPDSHGVPCETHFPIEEVDEIFGGTEKLAIEVVTDYASETFSATGPAVDDGLVCANGTIEFGGNPDAHPAAIWRWEDLHTCDDGSGTFILGVEAFHEDPGQRIAGVWDIPSGTDRYEGLTGGGGVHTTYVPDETVSIGWVWPAENES